MHALEHHIRHCTDTTLCADTTWCKTLLAKAGMKMNVQNEGPNVRGVQDLQ